MLVAALTGNAALRSQTAPPVSQDTSGGQAHTQPSENRALSAEEQSCKAFVQNFYDWYWNRFADEADNPNFDMRKEPNVWTVLKHRPSVMSPELRRLLANEEKQMKVVQGINNLDFDPFLSTQDPRGKYIVDHVKIAGNRCEATILEGHLIAETEKHGAGWFFANFHYAFYSEDGKTKEFPDEDLIGILSRKN